MNEPSPWTTIVSKTAYSNPWMTVREDTVVRPDGSDGMYGVIETRDSVVVVAMNTDDHIYMIRSFSYPSGCWRWGLPGGGGDNQDAKTASQRELVEETGITAELWNMLGNVRVSGGLMTEKMAVYLARNLTVGTRLAADDTEIITDGMFMSLDDIDIMISEGNIDDSQSITGIYFAKEWLRHN